jgi:hypothetical protein
MSAQNLRKVEQIFTPGSPFGSIGKLSKSIPVASAAVMRYHNDRYQTYLSNRFVLSRSASKLSSGIFLSQEQLTNNGAIIKINLIK